MARNLTKKHRPGYYTLRLHITVCIAGSAAVPTFVASQLLLRHYGLI